MFGGQDVLDQVRQVDLVPEPEGGLDSRLVGQIGEDVEERAGVGEGTVFESEEAVDEPLRDVFGIGIHVDGEVEQVADCHLVGRGRRLEHVQSLDDDDIRAPNRDDGIRNDVVLHVGVEGSADLGRPTLDVGEELYERTPVVGLGEALAVHDAAALELRVGVEEAVGGHELDARGVGPAAHELAQQARDGGLADGD